MKKRESYKKHLNRGVMAVSFAVIFIVFSIMGGRIQAFADDAVATQTDAAKSNSSGRTCHNRACHRWILR